MCHGTGAHVPGLGVGPWREESAGSGGGYPDGGGSGRALDSHSCSVSSSFLTGARPGNS